MGPLPIPEITYGSSPSINWLRLLPAKISSRWLRVVLKQSHQYCTCSPIFWRDVIFDLLGVICNVWQIGRLVWKWNAYCPLSLIIRAHVILAYLTCFLFYLSVCKSLSDRSHCPDDVSHCAALPQTILPLPLHRTPDNTYQGLLAIQTKMRLPGQKCLSRVQTN